MRRLLTFAAAFAVIALPAAATARNITLADLRGEVGVSEPHLSPDGREIAFVKGVQDFDKDRTDTQLMLLDVRTDTIRPLTFERQDLSSPRWSPSGDRLAFIADAGSGDDATAQIFVMPMDGGDARQITTCANGVQEFEWGPGGRAIAYVTQDDATNKTAIDAGNDAFEMGDLDYKSTAAAVPSHLWIVPAGGGQARRLTSGSWSLSSTNGGAGFGISWSHDGQLIAITRLPNAVYGDSDAATIAVVDAKTGRAIDVSGQRTFEVSPLFAPAGTDMLILWFRHGTFNSNASLLLGSSHGGAVKPLNAGFDHMVDWAEWTPKGDAVMVGAEDGPLTGLWRQPVDGSAPQRVALGDVNFGDGDVGKTGAIAFVGVTSTHPGEIYYLASPTATPRRMTDYNAKIAALSLGAEREVTWTGPGGYHEDGVLTLPPSFSPQRKYPLVLVVHGGPQGASQFSFDELTQLLAAHGYVTFQPNYRGSTNLGDAYQHAIYRDTGDGPGKDAMAGVAAVEKLGFIDTTRLAVSGWSYGGYMTTWLESHFDVWKCAMSGAALTDWVADYTIAWYQKGDADFFGPSPWTNAGWQIWREQSPIDYVQRVKAPTLIMGDVGDANVPLYNSYQWYHGLRDNGVPVEFVAYPRNSHFPDDPVGSESVTRRWVDWIVKYLH
jgi:dipeptidyl aminopeptidase/acylaminoacyl peptidase